MKSIYGINFSPFGVRYFFVQQAPYGGFCVCARHNNMRLTVMVVSDFAEAENKSFALNEKFGLPNNKVFELAVDARSIASEAE